MQVQNQTSTIVNKSFNSPCTNSALKEVVQLCRVNLKTFIEKQDGKFVSITFVKQDGSIRTLTGRLGVKAYLNGGSNTVVAEDRPYITVFDVQLRQYRTVNLETVRELRAANKIVRVI